MGRKKPLVIEDDEYSVGTEESKVEDEKVVAPSIGKKGKKGNSKAAKRDEEFNEDDEVVFTGKKKSKSKKKSGGNAFSSSSFGILEAAEEEEDVQSVVTGNSEEEDEEVLKFSESKKPKLNKKTGGTAFDAIGDEGDSDGVVDDDDIVNKSNAADDDDNEDEPAIVFTGKKKASKGGKKGENVVSTSFLALEDDDENNDADEKNDEDDDISMITFTGKKKKSKKKVGSEIADLVDPEQTTAPTSKVEVDDSHLSTTKDAEPSKSKKKKKKRTAQEEDDLDKILAELGEIPQKPAPPQINEEKAEVPVDTSASKEAQEEGTVESAAAKKKKKKKEKKAAAASSVDVKDEKQEAAKIEPAIEPKKKEVKGKAAEKKVPKHVREMQEALARRQEEEERRRKEEEEKLKREEEERRKQEELEMQKEEAKRMKKEKEKQKILELKKAGLYKTPKQKEEEKRRQQMREQLLKNLPNADNEKPAKKPLYQKNKSKPAATKPVEVKEESQQVTVPELHSVELEKVEEQESVEVSKSVEDNALVQEEDDDDDDDEWDAKSWDDDAVVNLSFKSGFSDEEVEPVANKGMKPAASVHSHPLKPHVVEMQKKQAEVEPAVNKGMKPAASVPSQPFKPQEVENRKKQVEVEADDAAGKKEAQTSDSASKEDHSDLRSPICCIMGHVDTGKTKLLDCIRGTNVQEGEAGGITQQIGATYFPAENIRERTKELKADAKLKVPGLLVIDTPGHESFTNLRSRGSGLCDIAILVVDIMHGLEPQTIESLNLLKMRNTEFIVALNKVDRLYGWKTFRNQPIRKAMKQQSKDVLNEYDRRVTEIITQFKEQGLNTELYYKNKEMGETYSIVPTSAISGEGIPDLLLLLVQWAQKSMVEKLTYSNEIQCTVLEVKVIEGLGTTIDVVLVNGVLHEGDQIVVCGMQGPIVTTIRALLTPHPMKELRVKGTYLHHSQIKAAQGIKITAQGLEHAIAGTALYVVGPLDDLDDIKKTAMEDMKSVLNRIDKSGEGVCVQASTLGSLEALLEFLKTPEVNIPVSGISIGPVHKKDVMKASVMLEKKKEYATILAFDVKVTPEARDIAEELGVKIFLADIIYHLFDQFKAYIDNLKEEKKKEDADEAVFPCVLKILPNCVFRKKDPILVGVEVLEGIAKVGAPICIPQRDFIDIGRLASIKNNNKPVDIAKKGQKVAIQIVGTNSDEQQKMYGRHFEMEDELVSRISRKSIDVLKTSYRDELSIEEWKLVVKLKRLFEIS
ncbi:eukaryotic translation initiation factor 5B-like [Argentina anserina]|uniref:eukaryotic translation initiation factor 5B-like n=1 Tax=Argentina anserina TaxID=57926 RepID=UPI0021762E72|nr:eukaryotic translation initiation factor 5B-like [Potentilla anserina]